MTTLGRLPRLFLAASLALALAPTKPAFAEGSDGPADGVGLECNISYLGVYGNAIYHPRFPDEEVLLYHTPVNTPIDFFFGVTGACNEQGHTISVNFGGEEGAIKGTITRHDRWVWAGGYTYTPAHNYKGPDYVRVWSTLGNARADFIIIFEVGNSGSDTDGGGDDGGPTTGDTDGDADGGSTVTTGGGDTGDTGGASTDGIGDAGGGDVGGDATTGDTDTGATDGGATTGDTDTGDVGDTGDHGDTGGPGMCPDPEDRIPGVIYSECEDVDGGPSDTGGTTGGSTDGTTDGGTGDTGGTTGDDDTGGTTGNEERPDETVPTVRLISGQENASENAGSFALVVVREGNLEVASAVDYRTAGVPAPGAAARAGSDYTGVSGTLVFEAGEDQKVVTVPILPDAVPEASEAFLFALEKPVRANIGHWSQAVLTIEDDDKAASGQDREQPAAKTVFSPGGEPMPIAVTMPEPGRVTIQIFDSSGELVKNLADEDRMAGEAVFHWDGRNSQGSKVASGVYLMVIERNGKREMRKIGVLR